MKSIELTEEHKNKLLEMCEVLFNDNKHYTNFRFRPIVYKDGYFLGKNKRIDSEYIQWLNQETGGSSEIHWFEFLVLKLLEKLARHKNLKVSEFEPLLINIYKEETHPVHILYFEYKFKKIKND